MVLARIEGNIVATVCHGSLRGWRLLICQPVDELGALAGEPIIAVDTMGAGVGQVVVLTSDGQKTRDVVGDERSPLRYTVLGVVDDLEEANA